MKKKIILTLMLGICLPIVAQQVDEINLKGVEVKAARFV